MASGGSLKVKLPSFTSTSWLIAQPPASSVNLSSKTTWVPSQAGVGSTKPTQQRSAAATPSPVLAISGFPRSQASCATPRKNPYRVGRPSATVVGGGQLSIPHFRLLEAPAATIYTVELQLREHERC